MQDREVAEGKVKEKKESKSEELGNGSSSFFCQPLFQVQAERLSFDSVLLRWLKRQR